MKIGRKQVGRIAGLLLLLLLLLFLGPSAAQALEAPELTLAGPEDLIAFGESVRAGETFRGRRVVLSGNIDMTGYDFAPIGARTGGGAVAFEGEFDGGGHAILGLRVTGVPGGGGGAGLFAALENASVRDLWLDGQVSAAGQSVVGALAGRAKNCSLANVTAAVTVTAAAWAAPERGYLAAGGLVGEAEDTVMDRCAAQGSLGAAGSFQGPVYAGGLAGLLDRCRVSSCTPRPRSTSTTGASWWAPLPA